MLCACRPTTGIQPPAPPRPLSPRRRLTRTVVALSFGKAGVPSTAMYFIDRGEVDVLLPQVQTDPTRPSPGTLKARYVQPDAGRPAAAAPLASAPGAGALGGAHTTAPNNFRQALWWQSSTERGFGPRAGESLRGRCEARGENLYSNLIYRRTSFADDIRA